MIPRTEIQRVAASNDVDPTVIDHDYALGCFLHFLAQEESVHRGWIFKGGTALAKCWFPDYRFSEDLDFTAEELLTAESMTSMLESAGRRLQDSLGIRTDLRDPSVETVDDEYGRESFEGKVYYQGIWQFRGDPRAIKIHVNRNEVLRFPPASKGIIHRYSDHDELEHPEMRVYALEEVVVEKLRAFSGQRRFTVARDVFDLHFLSTKADVPSALNAFRDKCAVKGLDVTKIDVSAIRDKKDQYRINWEKNLEFLLPQPLRRLFDEAWETATRLLEEAKAAA